MHHPYTNSVVNQPCSTLFFCFDSIHSAGGPPLARTSHPPSVSGAMRHGGGRPQGQSAVGTHATLLSSPLLYSRSTVTDRRSYIRTSIRTLVDTRTHMHTYIHTYAQIHTNISHTLAKRGHRFCTHASHLLSHPCTAHISYTSR